jgi:hypothetical protein
MPDAQQRFDEVAGALMSQPDVERAKMFGVPCMTVGGKAFAAFHHDRMVFKLGGAAHAQALQMPGAELFDPSGKGRPMKQWIALPYQHQAIWETLARQALEYVASLSPK